MNCACCDYKSNYKVLFEGEYVVLIEAKDEKPDGSCMIIPKAHRESPFDLSDEEWIDTKNVLAMTKKLIEEKYKPDGYNLGWNVGSTGGQFVFHSHLHIVPRFADEPFAGKGIRSWFLSEENRRPCM